MMIDDQYKDKILDHYKHPRHWGELKGADKKISVTNPYCGDEVHVQMKINGGKVTDVAFTSRGCVISTAATSMLAEYIKGKSIKKLKQLNKERLLELLGIQIGPVRMKCALLPLEALLGMIRDL